MTKQSISTINVHHTDPPTVSRLTHSEDDDQREFFIIYVGVVKLFFDNDAELQLWVSTLITQMHSVLASPEPTP